MPGDSPADELEGSDGKLILGCVECPLQVRSTSCTIVAPTLNTIGLCPSKSSLVMSRPLLTVISIVTRCGLASADSLKVTLTPGPTAELALSRGTEVQSHSSRARLGAELRNC